MEEDAWLMKIETKREEPTDAIKGDKGKEITVDPSPVATQALLAEEEDEDILKPYLTHLTPAEIEAFCVFEIVRIQNKHLTHENILHQEHIAYLRSVIRRLQDLFALKDKISSPPKENWVSGMGTPLGFCQAWGRCPGILSSHYLFAYFSSIFCLDE